MNSKQLEQLSACIITGMNDEIEAQGACCTRENVVGLVRAGLDRVISQVKKWEQTESSQAALGEQHKAGRAVPSPAPRSGGALHARLNGGVSIQLCDYVHGLYRAELEATRAAVLEGHENLKRAEAARAAIGQQWQLAQKHEEKLEAEVKAFKDELEGDNGLRAKNEAGWTLARTRIEHINKLNAKIVELECADAHNPEGVTREQLGEYFRFLTKREHAWRRTHRHSAWHNSALSVWRSSTNMWDGYHILGTAADLTYRVPAGAPIMDGRHLSEEKPAPTDNQVLEAMISQGGVFTTQLGIAARAASPNQLQRIKAAFPADWAYFVKKLETAAK
jgi:hypothetical protein